MKIFKFAMLILIAINLSGCLAKQAPKLDFYALNYKTNKICNNENSKKIYIDRIEISPIYQTRDILIFDDDKIEILNNSKFIAYPNLMLENALRSFLNENCNFTVTNDKNLSDIKIKIYINEIYISKNKTRISLNAIISQAGKNREFTVLKEKDINHFDSSNAILALNSNLKDLFNELLAKLNDN